jgi:hypothetical protein
MTKTGQAALAILAAIFMTAAIGTPAAQAQRLTCNGYNDLVPSPGCTPVHFFWQQVGGGRLR